MDDPRTTSQLASFVVQVGLVSDQAMQALIRELPAGERLAQALVKSGLVAADRLAQALSYHIGMPWVSLRHVIFSPQLIKLVPGQLAASFGVVPVYLRQSMDESVAPTLYCATDDPTNPHTMGQCVKASGLTVRMMVATAPDVSIALAREYQIGNAPTELWDIPSPEPSAVCSNDVLSCSVGVQPTAPSVSNQASSVSVLSVREFEDAQTLNGAAESDNVSGVTQIPDVMGETVVVRRKNAGQMAPCVAVGTASTDFVRRCRLAVRRFPVRVVRAERRAASELRAANPVVMLVDSSDYGDHPFAWSALAVELGCPLSVLHADFNGQQASSFVQLVLTRWISRNK